jgi:hypothetical protein
MKQAQCTHEKKMLLGTYWQWCSYCGAVQELVDDKPYADWYHPVPKFAPPTKELPWGYINDDEIIVEGDKVYCSSFNVYVDAVDYYGGKVGDYKDKRFIRRRSG